VKILSGICVLAALLTTSTAKAISLVVMAVNTTAVPGDKVFTIGVQINEADLTATGVGDRPPLFVQDIKFGNGNAGPLQQSGLSNQSSLQGAETVYAVDGSAGSDALYRDSWWYSGSPVLAPNGGVDGNPIISSDAGVMNGSAGGGINVGPLGYTFSEFAVKTPNSTTGQTMSFTGMYGPLGGNVFIDAPLINQFVSGVLTLPLAQIVADGNVAIPSDWAHGLGTGLILGQGVFNVLGGPGDIDPAAFLNYNNNDIESGNGMGLAVAAVSSLPIAHGPEPSSLALAALGALCLTLAARHHRRQAR
jgi:PEP-CTERM motif